MIISENPKIFARLMRLGQAARAEGDSKQAHLFWRQAALLQPDNEQVWLALLQILSSEEDRRVCLRNILAINPHNKYARDLFDSLIEATQPAAPLPPQPAPHEAAPRRRHWLRVILRPLEALLLGILIAIGIIGIQFISF